MKRHITLVLLLAAALAYLKTQRPMLYNQMLLNGTLWPHLQDAQKTACAWLERTMTTLLDKSPRRTKSAHSFSGWRT
ncbi:MAG: TnpV protein [Faecalibacterium prausnitzii]|nr:TnpV protein [Faecalibacterium prausnitzii]HJH99574.1 TnpV protein [Faecalibacterium prausnitzii]